MKTPSVADDFFDQIAIEFVSRLRSSSSDRPGHFLVILDGDRLTAISLESDTEGMAVDSILGFHVDGGADAAAFVTPTPDYLVAQVLFSDPRHFDLRRTPLGRPGKERSPRSWESIL